jgi:hypothetical protein
MGSSQNEQGRSPDKGPRHQVTIPYRCVPKTLSELMT